MSSYRTTSPSKLATGLRTLSSIALSSGANSLRAAALATSALAATTAVHAGAPQDMQVWKDPNCGCCKFWIEHMQENGFRVKVHETGNDAIRAKLGLPEHYGSCHTAVVGGYLVEGHVPAADVKKLLAQRPKALGIAVPGMPVGSPGMDGPMYRGRKDAYDVLLVAKSESGARLSSTVFSSHR